MRTAQMKASQVYPLSLCQAIRDELVSHFAYEYPKGFGGGVFRLGGNGGDAPAVPEQAAPRPPQRELLAIEGKTHGDGEDDDGKDDGGEVAIIQPKKYAAVDIRAWLSPPCLASSARPSRIAAQQIATPLNAASSRTFKCKLKHGLDIELDDYVFVVK